jgi:hypothetical protein
MHDRLMDAARMRGSIPKIRIADFCVGLKPLLASMLVIIGLGVVNEQGQCAGRGRCELYS